MQQTLHSFIAYLLSVLSVPFTNRFCKVFVCSPEVSPVQCQGVHWFWWPQFSLLWYSSGSTQLTKPLGIYKVMRLGQNMSRFSKGHGQSHDDHVLPSPRVPSINPVNYFSDIFSCEAFFGHMLASKYETSYGTQHGYVRDILDIPV